MRELRVALTLEDYERAVAFYRDALGLPVRMSWDEPEGSGTILEAGRATLELLSPDQAELIDRVEVGRRVAGPVRLALEVEDSGRTAEALAAAGAELLAPATETPWGDLNARVRAPDGMQLTLFTVAGLAAEQAERETAQASPTPGFLLAPNALPLSSGPDVRMKLALLLRPAGASLRIKSHPGHRSPAG